MSQGSGASEEAVRGFDSSDDKDGDQHGASSSRIGRADLRDACEGQWNESWN